MNKWQGVEKANSSEFSECIAIIGSSLCDRILSSRNAELILNDRDSKFDKNISPQGKKPHRG